MEENQAQLGLCWGPGWRRTRCSWGCTGGAQDGGEAGSVGAVLGPRLEEDQVQLGLHWEGPSWRGPGTVGAALGPRMEEDQAQLGLLLGLGWSGAWHRWGRFGARAGAGTVEALSGPRRKGAQAQPVPWGLGWRRTWHSRGCFGA